MKIDGEAMPRSVIKGDEVLAGGIEENGLLNTRVSKTYGESPVSRILDLVENAATKKEETERFITKFARYYTPVVVLLALLIGIVPQEGYTKEELLKYTYPREKISHHPILYL